MIISKRWSREEKYGFSFLFWFDLSLSSLPNPRHLHVLPFFFSVPHLLWHVTSVYNGHLRGPVTLLLPLLSENGMTLICLKLNLLHPAEFGTSFEQTWNSITQGCLVLSLVGFGEEDLWISSINFRNFNIFAPWKRSWFFILNKLEFPLLKDSLCQVWLKLVRWFSDRWADGRTDRQRMKCDKKAH